MKNDVFTGLMVLSAGVGLTVGCGEPSANTSSRENADAAPLFNLKMAGPAQFPTPESAVLYLIKKTSTDEFTEVVRVFAVAQIALKESPESYVDRLKMYDIHAPVPGCPEVSLWGHMGIAVSTFCQLRAALRGIRVNPYQTLPNSNEATVLLNKVRKKLRVDQIRIERIDLHDTDGRSPEAKRYHQMVLGVTDQKMGDASVTTEDSQVQFSFSLLKFGQNWLFDGIFSIQVLPKDQDEASLEACIGNLKQLVFAARLWGMDHSEQMPKSFDEMKDEILSPKILVCPANMARESQPTHSSYEILAPGVSLHASEKAFIKCRIHRCVLRVSGDLEKTESAQRSPQALYSKPNSHPSLTQSGAKQFARTSAPNVLPSGEAQSSPEIAPSFPGLSPEARPRRFQGFFNGGLGNPKTGETYMIFVDFERDAIPSSGMKKVHRSEFLAKLTSDPKLLTDAIEAAAANARAGFYDTRKWGSAKDKVCVAVFPRGTLTLDLNGTQTTPVSFTPGTVMGLAPLKEQFGDPGEIEDWAGGLGERLRIERFVYWWDEVGVAASPDGSITHVFLRLESKLKHR